MQTINMVDTIKQEVSSGYAPVNGLKMYYEIHGEGRPLVLIHGGGSSIQTSFGKVLPLFARHYRVIAMELQAHGRTDDRDAPESFEQDADDVAALMQHLDIPAGFILGFSNGGNTAMQMALRHPALVDKLVIASSFYKREGLLPGFFEGMKDATIDLMPMALQEAFLLVNPDRDRLQAMFNKDKERMLHFTDWKAEWLRSIKPPTFIISGDQDVIVPSHAAEMASLIPNARLMILPASHGAYFGAAEVPPPSDNIIAMTVDMIRSFLEN